MENSVDLTKLSPSEILKPSSIKSYKETLELIWQQVVRLRSNLFILGKLLKFPSAPEYLFFGPDQQDLFGLANVAFTENSVLIITKLTTYRRSWLSMSRFTSWIRDNIKQEHLAAFDCLLKESSFNKTIEKSRKTVSDIRNKRVAHLEVDENLCPQVSTDKISYQEMFSIASELKRLFDLLCFGIEHPTIPRQYDLTVQYPIGADSRSDIEYFLDLLIQDSHLFKMPDESPYWNIEKETFSPEIIDILNKYRRKFGKSEV